MKDWKKILLIVLIVIIVIVAILWIATGSEEDETTNTVTASDEESSEEEDELDEAEQFKLDLSNLTSDEIIENAEAQMADPEEGETIAIFHIEDYGDITVKFFEDVAPNAVENFITHAEEGYYDGLTFHRVIEEFMIQGGDPEGDGSGGESIWGEDFAEELSTTVLPYKGALCMASQGTGTSTLGSQFFIVQANYTDTMESYLSYYGYSNLLTSYQTYGGDLYDLAIYAQYTTFGQVIDGLDIVDEIAAVDTDDSDKPVEDVIISSIEITTYTEQ